MLTGTSGVIGSPTHTMNNILNQTGCVKLLLETTAYGSSASVDKMCFILATRELISEGPVFCSGTKRKEKERKKDPKTEDKKVCITFT